MTSTFNKDVLFIAPILLAVLLTACNSDNGAQTHQHEEYTCPMHPQVSQDKPGTCPICGMELVKKSNGGDAPAITGELKELIKPTNTSVVAAIQSIHPERKTLSVNITAPGVISYDTRNTYAVPVRFGGRIEKLYLKYNFQPVRKGQVILEIYSPELVTAQRELLYVVNAHKDQKEIVEGARQKLLLLGLTEDQIDKIIAAGTETFAFPVLSPYSGYIVEATNPVPEVPFASLAQPAPMGGGMPKKAAGGIQPAAAMNGSSSAPSPGAQFSVREGMYLATGQSIFNVVDDTRVWAELYFSAGERKQIRKGDAVHLLVQGSGHPIASRVDFIQPFFSEGKQFLQVRSYLNGNKNNLRIGQLVTARLSQAYPQSLWVPKAAVLDLGVQQIVFLKVDGTFAPFRVKTGSESAGWIEIREGLSESSEIAANAQYLVDSESFIRVINP